MVCITHLMSRHIVSLLNRCLRQSHTGCVFEIRQFFGLGYFTEPGLLEGQCVCVYQIVDQSMTVIWHDIEHRLTFWSRHGMQILSTHCTGLMMRGWHCF